MKTRLLFLTIILIAGACSKDNIAKQNAAVSAGGNSDAVSVCDRFTYGDSIFYVRPADTGDYIIRPLNKQSGTYGAFPLGLIINKVNGNINVSKSETGLEYIVWFVKNGTTDTCKKFMKISGVDYNDTIYVMSQGTAYGKPIYNSNASLQVDCSSGCEFDDGADDDNGNGIADEPPPGHEVSKQGIVINKTTGQIDFSASIKKGALGKNPLDGAEKDFTLYYRVGDKSKKALNKVAFTLFYYTNKADIPAKLLDDISAKQGQVIREDEDDDGGGGGNGHGGGHGHGGGNDDDKFAGYNLSGNANIVSKNGQGETKCRPPYIIVTQN